MAACVLAYLWERALGSAMTAAIYRLGFVPADYFAPGPPAASLPAGGTILTSMFLHGGILHLAGNMLYLWIFGNNIEDALGHLRFALFYVFCGAAAALTIAYVDPHSTVPMVGASGAIAGVLAAYILLFPRARVTVIVPLGIILYPFTLGAIWVIGFWFLLQLISAALTDPGQPGTAWWAHVGGFGMGLILTPLLNLRRAAGQAVRRGPWSS